MQIAYRIAPLLQQVQQARASAETMALAAYRHARAHPDETFEAGKTIFDVAKEGIEGAEKAARSTERAHAAVHALEAAARHSRIAVQLGFDYARAQREFSMAEYLARDLKSPAAASALTFLRQSLGETRAAFEREYFFLQRYRDIAARLKDGKSSALGEAAIAAEKLVKASPTGKWIIEKGAPSVLTFGTHALNVIAAGVSAIKAYHDAPTNSKPWKVTHGVAAAGVSALGAMP